VQKVTIFQIFYEPSIPSNKRLKPRDLLLLINHDSERRKINRKVIEEFSNGI